jgi:hypothetical protein
MKRVTLSAFATAGMYARHSKPRNENLLLPGSARVPGFRIDPETRDWVHSDARIQIIPFPTRGLVT